MAMKKTPLKTEKKEDNSCLSSGIFSVILSAGLFCMTFSHKKTFSNSAIGPVAIPRAVCIAICILGLILIFKGIKGRKKNGDSTLIEGAKATSPEKSTDDQKLAVFRKITAPVSFALIALYLLLMKKIGFALSSCLYITMQIPLLSADISPKSFLKSFVIGAVSSAIIYLVFGEVFQLYLPTSGWGF